MNCVHSSRRYFALMSKNVLWTCFPNSSIVIFILPHQKLSLPFCLDLVPTLGTLLFSVIHWSAAGGICSKTRFRFILHIPSNEKRKLCLHRAYSVPIFLLCPTIVVVSGTYYLNTLSESAKNLFLSSCFFFFILTAYYNIVMYTQ